MPTVRCLDSHPVPWLPVVPPPHVRGLTPGLPVSIFYLTGTRAVTGRPVGGRDPGVRRPPGQNCPSLPAFDPFLGFSAAGWLLSAPGRSCLHLPPALSLLGFPSRPFPVCPCAHVKNKPPLLPSPVGFPREARLGPVCPLKADVCFVTRNDWAARSGCTGSSPGGKEGLRGVPSLTSTVSLTRCGRLLETTPAPLGCGSSTF